MTKEAACEYPELGTVRLVFSGPPEGEGYDVEFCLLYEGPLPAEGSGGKRTKEKHAIRKYLHRQLKELWKQMPCLKGNIDFFAQNYDRCGFKFVPLVNHHLCLSCSLDILFLRRDAPGNLVKSGGDIDNRIKVLFDALRIVNSRDELGGNTPDADEDPFYCLLEDDSLITAVNITTERLLTPFDRVKGDMNDVVLTIRVATKITDEFNL